MGEDQIVEEEKQEEEKEPEEPTVRERAEQVGERWDQPLEDFRLPCPVDQGTMRAQGVAYNRLYEFAAGEPGVVNPVDVFMISFACDRCGYTAAFDAQEFNPAYLADLEGEPAEEASHLTRSGYRILVPLQRVEQQKTLLDLATALADARQGDVLVLNLASREPAESSLEESVRKYEPVVGNRTPYLAVHEGQKEPRDILEEALSQFGGDLLLLPVRGSPDQEAGILDLMRGKLTSHERDTGLVYDRGLESVKRVLLATSGGVNAQAAAPLVLDVVKAFRAELRILYVAREEEDEGKDEGLSRISDTLEGIDVADTEVQKRVIVSQDPQRAIIDQAQDCDLLILGGSPPDRSGRFRRDSFAAQIGEKAGVTTILTFARRREREPWLKRILLGTE